jgi:D-alanyl-D-alanine dipeptidase
MAPTAILTNEAAQALKTVSEELDTQGYSIKVFDGYRPQKAVNHFIRWATDINDVKMKLWYFPRVEKGDLFKLGYISEKSGHTRGSTIDLTLVYKKTGEELDMGSSFDFLDNISAHDTTLITAEQAANRRILKTAMQKHGFKYYAREWWHYTLINEPYPDQYFDFNVN